MKRWLAFLVAIVYTLSNVVLLHAQEKNIWEERRRKTLVYFPPESSSLRLLPSRPQPSLTPVTAPLVAKAYRSLPENLKSVAQAIPLSRVNVKEIFQGNDLSARPVVLVEDVHLNPEAQENNAAALLGLLEKGRLDAIGVEGGFQKFDFSPFNQIPEGKLRNDVVGAFLEKGLIGAPSYVGLVRPSVIVEMRGVDDRESYRKNVDAYIQSGAQKERVVAGIESERKKLAQRMEAEFSGDLQAYASLRQSYQDKQVSLAGYAEGLARWSRPEDMELTLERFLEAVRMEKELDFSAVERERRGIVEALGGKLDEKKTDALLAQSVAYRSGEIGFGEYYGSLKKLCEETGVPLRAAPAFDRYIQYALLSDGIKPEKLFRAVSDLENSVESRLAATPAQNKLLASGRQLSLVEKLVSFELTPDEWEDYRRSIDHSPWSIDQKLSSFESFYKEADVRSAKMVQNILSLSAQKKQGGASALVLGGFHTPMVARALRARNVPHIVVSPKITKIDGEGGSAYLGIFAQRKTPLDRLFAGEKLFILPETVNVAGSTELGAMQVAEAIQGVLFTEGQAHGLPTMNQPETDDLEFKHMEKGTFLHTEVTRRDALRAGVWGAAVGLFAYLGIGRSAAKAQPPAAPPAVPVFDANAALRDLENALAIFEKDNRFVASSPGDIRIGGWSILYDNAMYAQLKAAQARDSRLSEEDRVRAVRQAADYLKLIASKWPVRAGENMVFYDEINRKPVEFAYASSARSASGTGVEWKVDSGPMIHLGLAAMRIYQIAASVDPVGANNAQYDDLVNIALKQADYARSLARAGDNVGLWVPYGPVGGSSPVDQKFNYDVTADRFYDVAATEHQLDAYALWRGLSDMVKQSGRFNAYRNRVRPYEAALPELRRFIRGLWDEKAGVFRSGWNHRTGAYDEIHPTDAQAWAVSMLGVEGLVDLLPNGAADVERLFTILDQQHAVMRDGKIIGYRFRPGRFPISIEWSMQVAAAKAHFAQYLTKRPDIAATIRTTPAQYRDQARQLVEELVRLRQKDGTLYYAYSDSGRPAVRVDTGLSWDTHARSLISNVYSSFVLRNYDPLAALDRDLGLFELIGEPGPVQPIAALQSRSADPVVQAEKPAPLIEGDKNAGGRGTFGVRRSARALIGSGLAIAALMVTVFVPQTTRDAETLFGRSVGRPLREFWFVLPSVVLLLMFPTLAPLTIGLFAATSVGFAFIHSPGSEKQDVLVRALAAFGVLAGAFVIASLLFGGGIHQPLQLLIQGFTSNRQTLSFIGLTVVLHGVWNAFAKKEWRLALGKDDGKSGVRRKTARERQANYFRALTEDDDFLKELENAGIGRDDFQEEVAPFVTLYLELLENRGEHVDFPVTVRPEVVEALQRFETRALLGLSIAQAVAESKNSDERDEVIRTRRDKLAGRLDTMLTACLYASTGLAGAKAQEAISNAFFLDDAEYEQKSRNVAINIDNAKVASVSLPWIEPVNRPAMLYFHSLIRDAGFQLAMQKIGIVTPRRLKDEVADFVQLYYSALADKIEDFRLPVVVRPEIVTAVQRYELKLLKISVEQTLADYNREERERQLEAVLAKEVDIMSNRLTHLMTAALYTLTGKAGREAMEAVGTMSFSGDVMYEKNRAKLPIAIGDHKGTIWFPWIKAKNKNDSGVGLSGVKLPQTGARPVEVRTPVSTIEREVGPAIEPTPQRAVRPPPKPLEPLGPAVQAPSATKKAVLRWALRVAVLAFVLAVTVGVFVFAPDALRIFLRATDLQYLSGARDVVAASVATKQGFVLVGLPVTYLTVRFALIFIEFAYRVLYAVLRRAVGLNGGYEVDFLSSRKEIRQGLRRRFQLTDTDIDKLGNNRAALLRLYFNLDRQDRRLADDQEERWLDAERQKKQQESWTRWGALMAPRFAWHFFEFLRDYFFKTDIERIRYGWHGRFVNHFESDEQGRLLIDAAVREVENLPARSWLRSTLTAFSTWYLRGNIFGAGLGMYLVRRVRITLFGAMAGLIASPVGLVVVGGVVGGFLVARGLVLRNAGQARAGGVVFAVAALFGYGFAPYLVDLFGFSLDDAVRSKFPMGPDETSLSAAGRYFRTALHHVSLSSASIITTFFTALGLNLHSQAMRVHQGLLHKNANPFSVSNQTAEKLDRISFESLHQALSQIDATESNKQKILDVLASTAGLLAAQQSLSWWDSRWFALGRFSEIERGALLDQINRIKATVGDYDPEEYGNQVAQRRETFLDQAPSIWSARAMAALGHDLLTRKFWRTQIKSMFGMWSLGAEIALVTELGGDIGGDAGRRSVQLLEGEQGSAMSLMSELQGFVMHPYGLGVANEKEVTGPSPEPEFRLKDALPKDVPLPERKPNGHGIDGRRLESDDFHYAEPWAEFSAAHWGRWQKSIGLEAGRAAEAETGWVRRLLGRGIAVELSEVPVDQRGGPIRIVDNQGRPLTEEIVPPENLFVLLKDRMSGETRVRRLLGLKYDPSSRTYEPPSGMRFVSMEFDLANPQILRERVVDPETGAVSSHRLRDRNGRAVPDRGLRVLKDPGLSIATVKWQDMEGFITGAAPSGKAARMINPETGNEVVFGRSADAARDMVRAAEKDAAIAVNWTKLLGRLLQEEAGFEVDAAYNVLKEFRKPDDVPSLIYYRYGTPDNPLVAFDPSLAPEEPIAEMRVKQADGTPGNRVFIGYKLPPRKMAENAQATRSITAGTWGTRSYPEDDSQVAPIFMFQVNRAAGSVAPIANAALAPWAQQPPYLNRFPLMNPIYFTNEHPSFPELWMTWKELQGPRAAFAAHVKANINERSSFFEVEKEFDKFPMQASQPPFVMDGKYYVHAIEKGKVVRFNLGDEATALQLRRTGAVPLKRNDGAWVVSVSYDDVVGGKTISRVVHKVLSGAEVRALGDPRHISTHNRSGLIRLVYGYALGKDGNVSRMFTSPTSLQEILQRPNLVYELSNGEKVLAHKVEGRPVVAVYLADGDRIVTGSEWEKLKYQMNESVRSEQRLRARGRPTPVVIDRGVPLVALQLDAYVAYKIEHQQFLLELAERIEMPFTAPAEREKLVRIYNESVRGQVYDRVGGAKVALGTPDVVIKGTPEESLLQSLKELKAIEDVLSREKLHTSLKGGTLNVNNGNLLRKIDIIDDDIRKANLQLRALVRAGVPERDQRDARGAIRTLIKERTDTVAELQKKKAAPIAPIRLFKDVADYRAEVELQKKYLAGLTRDINARIADLEQARLAGRANAVADLQREIRRLTWFRDTALQANSYMDADGHERQLVPSPSIANLEAGSETEKRERERQFLEIRWRLGLGEQVLVFRRTVVGTDGRPHIVQSRETDESRRIIQGRGERGEWFTIEKTAAIHEVRRPGFPTQVLIEPVERAIAAREEFLKTAKDPAVRERAIRTGVFEIADGKGAMDRWSLVHSDKGAERGLANARAILEAAEAAESQQTLIYATELDPATGLEKVGGQARVIKGEKDSAQYLNALSRRKFDLRKEYDRLSEESRKNPQAPEVRRKRQEAAAKLREVLRGIYSDKEWRYTVNYSLKDAAAFSDQLYSNYVNEFAPPTIKRWAVMDENSVIVGHTSWNGAYHVFTQPHLVDYEEKTGNTTVEIRTSVSSTPPSLDKPGRSVGVYRQIVDSRERVAARISGRLDGNTFKPDFITIHEYANNTDKVALRSKTYRYEEGLAIEGYAVKKIRGDSRILDQPDEMARVRRIVPDIEDKISYELMNAVGAKWWEIKNKAGRLLYRIEGGADEQGRFAPHRVIAFYYDHPDFAAVNVPFRSEVFDAETKEKIGWSQITTPFEEHVRTREFSYRRYMAPTQQLVDEVKNEQGLLIRRYIYKADRTALPDGNYRVNGYACYNVTIFKYGGKNDDRGLADEAYTFETDGEGRIIGRNKNGKFDGKTYDSKDPDLQPSELPYYAFTNIVSVDERAERRYVVYSIFIRSPGGELVERFHEIQDADGEVVQQQVGHRSSQADDSPFSFIPEQITLNTGYRNGAPKNSRTYSVWYDREADWFRANPDASIINYLDVPADQSWHERKARLNSGETLEYRLLLQEESNAEPFTPEGLLTYLRQTYAYIRDDDNRRLIRHTAEKFTDVVRDGYWVESNRVGSPTRLELHYDGRRTIESSLLYDTARHPSDVSRRPGAPVIEEVRREQTGIRKNPYLPDWDEQYWQVFHVDYRHGDLKTHHGKRWTDVYGKILVEVQNVGEGGFQQALSITLNDRPSNEDKAYPAGKPLSIEIPFASENAFGEKADGSDGDFIYFLAYRENVLDPDPNVTLTLRDHDRPGRAVEIKSSDFWIPTARNVLAVRDGSNTVTDRVRLVSDSIVRNRQFLFAVPVSLLKEKGLKVDELQNKARIDIAASKGSSNIRISRIFRAGREADRRQAGEQTDAAEPGREFSSRDVLRQGRTLVFDGVREEERYRGTGIDVLGADNKLLGTVRSYFYSDAKTSEPRELRRIVLFDESGRFPIASLGMKLVNGNWTVDRSDVLPFTIIRKDNIIWVYEKDPTTKLQYSTATPYRVDAIDPGRPEPGVEIGEMVRLVESADPGLRAKSRNRVYNSAYFYFFRRVFQGERAPEKPAGSDMTEEDLDRAVRAIADNERDLDEVLRMAHGRLDAANLRLPKERQPRIEDESADLSWRNFATWYGGAFLVLFSWPLWMWAYSWAWGRFWKWWRAGLDRPRALRNERNALRAEIHALETYAAMPNVPAEERAGLKQRHRAIAQGLKEVQQEIDELEGEELPLLYDDATMEKALGRFNERVLRTRTAMFDPHDKKKLIIVSDGDIEAGFLNNLFLVYVLVFAWASKMESADRAFPADRELKKMDELALAMARFFATELTRGSSAKDVRYSGPEYENSRLNSQIWNQLEIYLSVLRDDLKSAFLNDVKSDELANGEFKERFNTFLANDFVPTKDPNLPLAFLDGNFREFVRKERFSPVPAYFITGGRHIMKIMPVILGIFTVSGGEAIGLGNVFALSEWIVPTIMMLVALTLLINILTESRAVSHGRVMPYWGRLRAVPAIVAGTGIVYLLTQVTFTPIAFMFSTFVLTLLSLESAGLLRSNRSLFGVAAWYHLRPPIGPGRARAVLLMTLVYWIFALLAIGLGAYVLPWFIAKYMGGHVLWTFLAGLSFTIRLPLLHHGVNHGMRWLFTVLYPSIGSDVRAPPHDDPSDDPEPVPTNGDKTAVVHVAGNPMASQVFHKNAKDATKIYINELSYIMNAFAAGRRTFLPMFEAALRDEDLGFTQSRDDTLRDNEKLIALAQEWLSRLHEAEEHAGVTVWDTDQFDDPNAIEGLQVAPKASAAEKAAMRHAFKIRQALDELTGIGGSSLNTAINFVSQAKAFGKNNMASSMVYLLCMNQYADHNNPKKNPDAVGKSAEEIDKSLNVEMNQRAKLARYMKHVSRKNGGDGINAYVMYNHTIFGMKSAAMNALYMVPDELPHIKSIVITDRNSSSLDVGRFVRDVRRMQQDPSLAVIVARRNTTYTLDTMGLTSEAVEGGHGKSMESLPDKIGTGWYNIMRISFSDTIRLFAEPDAPFVSLAGERGREQGFMTRLFGMIGFAPNAVGISEDYWAVVQQFRDLVGLGHEPRVALSLAVALKVRESRDYAEWKAAVARWSSGLDQTMEELLNQMSNEFGPESIFEKEARQTNADHYLLGPIALFDMFMLTVSVIADMSPFVGISILFWIPGVLFSQISTGMGLAANWRTMGFWVGTSRWLSDWIPKAMLFASRVVREALAQISGHQGPSFEFKLSGGGAAQNPWKAIFPFWIDMKFESALLLRKRSVNNQTIYTLLTWKGVVNKSVDQLKADLVGTNAVDAILKDLNDSASLREESSLSNVHSFFWVFMIGMALIGLNMVAVAFFLDARNVFLIVLSLWFSVGVAFGPALFQRKQGMRGWLGLNDLGGKVAGFALGAVQIGTLMLALYAALTYLPTVAVPAILLGVIAAFVISKRYQTRLKINGDVKSQTILERLWGVWMFAALPVIGGVIHNFGLKQHSTPKDPEGEKDKRFYSEARRSYWLTLFLFGWGIFAPHHPIIRFDLFAGYPLVFSIEEFVIGIGVVIIIVLSIIVIGRLAILFAGGLDERLGRRKVEAEALHRRVRGTDGAIDNMINDLMTSITIFQQAEAYRLADEAMDRVESLINESTLIAIEKLERSHGSVDKAKKLLKDSKQALSDGNTKMAQDLIGEALLAPRIFANIRARHARMVESVRDRPDAKRRLYDRTQYFLAETRRYAALYAAGEFKEASQVARALLEEIRALEADVARAPVVAGAPTPGALGLWGWLGVSNFQTIGRVEGTITWLSALAFAGFGGIHPLATALLLVLAILAGHVLFGVSLPGEPATRRDARTVLKATATASISVVSVLFIWAAFQVPWPSGVVFALAGGIAAAWPHGELNRRSALDPRARKRALLMELVRAERLGVADLGEIGLSRDPHVTVQFIKGSDSAEIRMQVNADWKHFQRRLSQGLHPVYVAETPTAAAVLISLFGRDIEAGRVLIIMRNEAATLPELLIAIDKTADGRFMDRAALEKAEYSFVFHEAIDLRAFAGKEWDDKRYHLYVLLIEEALSSVAIRVPPSQIDNIQALLAAWRSA